jgi:hypothetical protein
LEELKRGEASLSLTPPSLPKGRGQGDRFLNNLLDLLMIIDYH